MVLFKEKIQVLMDSGTSMDLAGWLDGWVDSCNEVDDASRGLVLVGKGHANG